ncbi:hypothetical protein TELCIR_06400 [Teladorsagia circumcincta]|uniref:Uncharacterized protein n=1 Tax=Teladorsagia circumcincta TaxID=45464 RepID=A0A2G9UN51_TELCI|nr:hypothetical protein TELCIR_06400 [Teladorsagia circumcincta]
MRRRAIGQSPSTPHLPALSVQTKMLLQLISLVLLPFAVDAIGFGGCGCGMQIPPICLPSLPRIQLPSLCPPPSCGCGRKKRQVIRSPEVVASDDRKCSNDQLKEIILNVSHLESRKIKVKPCQSFTLRYVTLREYFGQN